MFRSTSRSRDVLILAGVLFLGCSESSSPGSSTGCTAATATSVTGATVVSMVSPMTYSPSCMKTTVGTTLTFRNDDAVQHTVTDLDHQPPSFDSGALGPGGTYQHAFGAPGTYRVYCTIHGVAMQATVIAQ